MCNKFAFSMLLMLFIVSFTFSCKKDDEQASDCDEKYYIPENQLNWFPYFAVDSVAGSNNSFKIEGQTYFMTPQELHFLNEALDTQAWKLIYVTDRFNKQIYHNCPYYQEIKYVIYNWQISQHIELGFVHRDTNYVTSSENTELYIPMINVGACTTKSEDWAGLLGGTCYSTSFDIYNFSRNSKIEHLETFETQFATYEDVFLIKINHNPDSMLDYDMYIAKNHGIVAYRNQDVLWSLK